MEFVMGKFRLVLLLVLILGCQRSIGENQGEIAAASAMREGVTVVPGENYLGQLKSLLAGAKESVTILQFSFFTQDGAMHEVAEQLIQLKVDKPGLKVDVVLEGEKDKEKVDGVFAKNSATKQMLEAGGIDVHFVSGQRAAGENDGVTHAKMVIVDGTVLTGSTNFTNTSTTKNNEYNVLIQNREVAAGLRRWVQELIVDSTRVMGKRFEFSSGHVLTDDLFLNEALEVIGATKAGDELLVAAYFFRVDKDGDGAAASVRDALMQAMVRGVKLKVYLEQTNSEKLNADVERSNKVVAAQLAEKGADVYFDPEAKISHSKIILVNGKLKTALLGSTNLYRGDLSENHQVNVRINDPLAIAKIYPWLSAKMAYEGIKFELSGQTLQHAAMMFRVWFGFAQDREHVDGLVRGVNQKLIPATTQYAQGRGLNAYLPVLLDAKNLVPAIPDEAAIIVYNSASQYEAARATLPYGPAYGPLHFSEGMFVKETPNKEKSASSVAQVYKGSEFKIKGGLTAYSLKAEKSDWQNAAIKLLVLKGQENSDFGMQAKELLNRLDAETKIGREVQSAIVGIDGDQKTILVWIADGRSPDGVKNITAGFRVLKTVDYTKQKVGHVAIGLNQGASVTFDRNLLGAKELWKPILNE
jgi:phosphatidylserine/phosphatidylglycerophosphate/cardiolipin synthase-like enzyme